MQNESRELLETQPDSRAEERNKRLKSIIAEVRHSDPAINFSQTQIDIALRLNKKEAEGLVAFLEKKPKISPRDELALRLYRFILSGDRRDLIGAKESEKITEKKELPKEKSAESPQDTFLVIERRWEPKKR